MNGGVVPVVRKLRGIKVAYEMIKVNKIEFASLKRADFESAEAFLFFLFLVRKRPNGKMPRIDFPSRILFHTFSRQANKKKNLRATSLPSDFPLPLHFFTSSPPYIYIAIFSLFIFIFLFF